MISYTSLVVDMQVCSKPTLLALGYNQAPLLFLQSDVISGNLVADLLGCGVLFYLILTENLALFEWHLTSGFRGRLLLLTDITWI